LIYRGGNGIGLETSIYLARKGCTVYIASRNKKNGDKAVELARKRAGSSNHGPIHFHTLDLSTIAGAKHSAQEFMTKEKRLDILIANAGVGMIPQDKLSADGFEKVFATNHIGHFTFIMELLRKSNVVYFLAGA
jgi:NAD(P)-dependent dehydrogenase (short-subunit alcohol dehydrogenase family)